ncbi:hypothetical protein [Shewanella surugensis]|uniref:Uncharacterized protein n=1 Tax=Shewanella surugensis TaxID=212020 RepID=A0ABT0LEF7_9GAMM|nr:hypothetical protein [Shewanella surugensis]MCL1126094.1 hypothetical protein [Shewanella surugensis]
MLKDYFLPVELLTDEYDGHFHCTKNKDVTLLEKDLPLAFYSMVNILVDSIILKNNKSSSIYSIINTLGVANACGMVNYMNGGKITWEQVFKDEIDRSKKNLISEIVIFMSNDKIYILYLRFTIYGGDLKLDSGETTKCIAFKFDFNLACNQYHSLLITLMSKLTIYAKNNQYKEIIVDVYNPNIEKVFSDFGFNVIRKQASEYIMPSSRMSFVL